MRAVVLATAIFVALGLGISAQGATEAVIKGTARGDQLEGTPQDDRIFGFAGSDGIRGLAGFDVLFGGLGEDTLSGGTGKNYLSGGGGADRLFISFASGALADFASCGAGDDVVVVDGAPESVRDRIVRQLHGPPSDCETIRFSG